MPSQEISLPAGYAPVFAVGFSADTSELSIVESTKPLPVAVDVSTPIPVQNASPVAPAALEDQVSAATVAGPFTPVSGLPVLLQLSGTWTGTVQVQRSIDGGTTRHDLSAGGSAWARFEGNACEHVWAEEEAGAHLYLDIAPDSGTVEFRLSQ